MNETTPQQAEDLQDRAEPDRSEVPEEIQHTPEAYREVLGAIKAAIAKL
jgi:hypothetical protein